MNNFNCSYTSIGSLSLSSRPRASALTEPNTSGITILPLQLKPNPNKPNINLINRHKKPRRHHLPKLQRNMPTPRHPTRTQTAPPHRRQPLGQPGELSVAPDLWTTTQKPSSSKANNHRTSTVISAYHIGRDLCGHPGFVHGGLLSVLFDEVFARCVSAAFQSGLGMTANLNVEFRKPALPERLYILRSRTVG